MPPTKTFPKYWVVDIKKNADHKLLPKFKEWFDTVSNSKCSHHMKYYGFEGSLTRSGYDYWDNISTFDNTPIIITLEYWNNHFFPKQKYKEGISYKEISFKKIKNTPQYKTQKALAEHYEELFKVSVKELNFSSLQVQTLYGALDEIVAMTTDPLAKKVASLAKERYETDKLIHARVLFSKK